MLNRKQIFDAITDDGKITIDGTEAQRIINRLMDLQSQNLQQTDCSTLREFVAHKYQSALKTVTNNFTSDRYGFYAKEATTFGNLLKFIDGLQPVA